MSDETTKASDCPVCTGATEPVRCTAQVRLYHGKTMQGTRCLGCGMLRFPENAGTYAEQLQHSEQERRYQERRNANDERAGREFHMAQMGIEILGRPQASVSFFGAGLNTDWQWLQRAYPQAQVKLVDLENMQQAPIFEPLTQATPSDIVVASEVIEHFEEHMAHFDRLLGLVKEDGLLICGTNLYDGSDVSHHEYPFVPGHVAYWTPHALAYVGIKTGYLVDFRLPQMALLGRASSKRYILFYRNVEMAYRIGVYFARHMHAPSEP